MTPKEVVVTLRDRYADEIETILERYPAEQKRSAVMPLIFLAQREQGYITGSAIDEIAELLDIASISIHHVQVRIPIASTAKRDGLTIVRIGSFGVITGFRCQSPQEISLQIGLENVGMGIKRPGIAAAFA